MDVLPSGDIHNEHESNYDDIDSFLDTLTPEQIEEYQQLLLQSEGRLKVRWSVNNLLVNRDIQSSCDLHTMYDTHYRISMDAHVTPNCGWLFNTTRCDDL